MRRKPRPIEFMLRGHDVATALAALAEWESLTDAEVEALGFSDCRSSGGEEHEQASLATRRPFLH